MELRSKFNKLKEILTGAGVYEDGMEIEEMRQVAAAMEMSVSSYTGPEYSNLERALLESEIDFQMMVNSTMIVEPAMPPPSIDVFIETGSFERECNSPPSNPIHLQVQAVVHHELNWSPTQVRPHKRETNEPDCGFYAKRACQTMEPEEASASSDVTPISMTSGDSGVSCDEVGTLSTFSESSTLPSIGEMPSRLLISTSSAVISDISSQPVISP
ncbi:uncharacterized protein LOC6577806 [Drosophila mojavensis]|uniref:Uncharacterized protein n=1 Tax=Drosophila mojavensis TaxID=7230 RepID=B4KG42_DROMO|nr:uncharacterized protein LOC6577806 [Drosophila mojavensis]EDW13181.1 uncharacterized protein Dmoj_GI18076 [Drosophila mojavensis]